ncbi:hypothetical protein PTSG_10687 [Salpingoeca rosetta]|uniref:Sulfotransferase family protein n=1 Tax=Salpingoeca rosetta (strain ATCC 50818 / BSB-021) TaxID=946362 RepID=F2UQ34_SALR5|nr:uncharacterized protein PTSG_10687 [Salpingoeca rosetta]EGD79702.1 hypothetical protein PTSG_10687 [Salpingoeca rosetta]|eukprot:XP_004988652.1 hypothetical protein PTSG_10687 [Salpingoeca rosetta]
MRRIILWTCPRCVSTAFERCFIGVEGVKVFHEPYGNPFYYGADRAQTPEAVGFAPGMDTFDGVLAALRADYPGFHTVFSKDMAYYLRNKMNAKYLRGFQHTLLMRHPCKTALSLWTKSRCEPDTGAPNASTGWTFFDVRDLGYRELYDIADFVLNHREEQQQQDGADDDLLLDPSGMMRAYCAATGLPYDAGMLTWEPGPVEAWNTWPGWHDDALRSTGLQKREHRKPAPSVAEVVAAMKADVCTLPHHHEHYNWQEIQAELQHAVDLYGKLYAHALKLE